MRKRVVIGAIAALLIGVSVRLLLERELKPGTIAWHKSEYFANRYQVTWKDRAVDKWERLSGRPQSKNLAFLESYVGWDSRKHVDALQKLGYFRCRGVKLPYSPHPDAPTKNWRPKPS